MAALIPPPLDMRRGRVPEKSATLPDLQEHGQESPRLRNNSVSPQSCIGTDNYSQMSPHSFISTSSELDTNIDSSQSNISRRPSAASFETMVSHILGLYTRSSRQSLRSDYEEMQRDSDGYEFEEERASIPSFHQPKAYRDTIAPLLEHQFSGEKLTVPAIPSPMSVASIPTLLHPNARESVASIEPTLETSSRLQPYAAQSQTSIQITPDMTPPLGPLRSSYQGYSNGTTEHKIALEVPDVRDADSWYDYPLSPVSPDDDDEAGRTRDSQLSNVSLEGEVGYIRQIAFDALAPPRPKESPKLRPVSFARHEGPSYPLPAAASEEVEFKMVPPPLDITRNRSLSRISEGSTSVHTPELRASDRDLDPLPKSQHASLVVKDPIEGPMRTYLTPEPIESKMASSPGNLSIPAGDIEVMYRPGSAFSDSTIESPVALVKFSGQLKQALKERFGRKRNKEDPVKKGKTQSNPIPVPKRSNTSRPAESYKYRYWKLRTSAPVTTDRSVGPDQFRSPGRRTGQPPDLGDQQLGAIQSRPSSSAQASPRLIRPDTWHQGFSQARNLTNSPDQNWYGVDKATSAHTSVASRKTASDGYIDSPTDYAWPLPQQKDYSSENRFRSGADLNQGYFHARPESKGGHVYTLSNSTNGSRQSVDTVATEISEPRPDSPSDKNVRKSGTVPIPYNNDLFEASGGSKKKSGIASRLLMTSEQRRRQKVKESIVIVGGAKMGDSESRSGATNSKPLVKT